jgi:hypothetical protein
MTCLILGGHVRDYLVWNVKTMLVGGVSMKTCWTCCPTYAQRTFIGCDLGLLNPWFRWSLWINPLDPLRSLCTSCCLCVLWRTQLEAFFVRRSYISGSGSAHASGSGIPLILFVWMIFYAWVNCQRSICPENEGKQITIWFWLENPVHVFVQHRAISELVVGAQKFMNRLLWDVITHFFQTSWNITTCKQPILQVTGTGYSKKRGVESSSMWHESLLLEYMWPLIDVYVDLHFLWGENMPLERFQTLFSAKIGKWNHWDLESEFSSCSYWDWTIAVFLLVSGWLGCCQHDEPRVVFLAGLEWIPGS